MNRIIKIVGYILIWIIVPFVVVIGGADVCSTLKLTGVAQRFAYGVITGAAFAVPFALCKIWRHIWEKVWGGQTENVTPEPPKNIVLEKSWQCPHCNTENSTYYAQCKKCGGFRS